MTTVDQNDLLKLKDASVVLDVDTKPIVTDSDESPYPPWCPFTKHPELLGVLKELVGAKIIKA